MLACGAASMKMMLDLQNPSSFGPSMVTAFSHNLLFGSRRVDSWCLRRLFLVSVTRSNDEVLAVVVKMKLFEKAPYKDRTMETNVGKTTTLRAC